MTNGYHPRLVEVLGEAREIGFLGPGQVGDQIRHADGFRRAWQEVAGPGAPGSALDLGSGGGVPGLVLALAWPSTAWTLLDSHRRRVEFLGRAVDRLGLADRVEVVRARAEEFGRRPGSRSAFPLVVSRSFGPPATTAECAAPLLASPGGVLLVSEPPEGAPGRWPADGLAFLGLRPGPSLAVPARLQALVQSSPCPVRYPRRTGVPAKRPLF
jgi:16S rRNA (guanine527-N7)-methyltransferase